MRGILLLLICSQAYPQSAPQVDWWQNALDGQGEIHDLAEHPEGYLLAGARFTDDGEEATLSCVSFGGELLWQQSFPSFGRARLNKLCATAEGWLAVGERQNGDAHPDAGLLIGLDANGDSSWSRLHSFEDSLSYFNALALPGGDLLCAGSIRDKALLCRTNSSGDTIWTWRGVLATDYFNRFQGLLLSPENQIYACGQGILDWHEWIHRKGVIASFTLDGELLNWNDSFDSRMSSMVWLPGSGPVATGEYQAAYLPVWFYNNELELIDYVQSGSASQNMRAFAIALDDSSHLLICGKYQTGPGNTDAFLLKLDSTGEEIWQGNYELCQTDVAESLLLQDDGHVLAGSCRPSRTSFLLKLQAEGVAVSPVQIESSGRLDVTQRAGKIWYRLVDEKKASRLRLFDMLGRELALVVPQGAAGSLVLDAPLATGRYILRAEFEHGPPSSASFTFLK